MKTRPHGFLSEENIDHNSEPFKYIQELHEYLWGFVRTFLPSANGNLSDFIDSAIMKSYEYDEAELARVKAERDEAVRLVDEAISEFEFGGQAKSALGLAIQEWRKKAIEFSQKVKP